jgi:hypothetical protein
MHDPSLKFSRAPQVVCWTNEFLDFAVQAVLEKISDQKILIASSRDAPAQQELSQNALIGKESHLASSQTRRRIAQKLDLPRTRNGDP